MSKFNNSDHVKTYKKGCDSPKIKTYETEFDCLISKQIIKVSEVEIIDRGFYLGKVYFDAGVLGNLEVSIHKNQKGKLYANVPGYSTITKTVVKDGEEIEVIVNSFYRIVDKSCYVKDGKMWDLYTAAIMVFVAYYKTKTKHLDLMGESQIQIPVRSSFKGICFSCLYKTIIDGVKVCSLNGMSVDDDWKKFNRYYETHDFGLNCGYKNGKFKKKATFRKNLEDLTSNCPNYSPRFYIDKEDKWVKIPAKQLPWDENFIVGGFLVIDGNRFVTEYRKDAIENEKAQKKERRLNSELRKIGLTQKGLLIIAKTPAPKGLTKEDTIRKIFECFNSTKALIDVDFLVQEAMSITTK